MFQTNVIENIKVHILRSVTFFFPQNRTVYEIMWKNTVEPGRLPMTTLRMRIAYLIPKSTNTHSECEILMLFHGNNGCTNAPQCYVTSAFPVLLLVRTTTHTDILQNIQWKK